MAVERMAVIGAGQMGSGIAQVAAQAGIEVVLADASPELAKKAVDKLGATLAKLVEKGKLSAGDRDQVLGRIKPARGVEDCGGADLAIEAILENEGAKKEISASSTRCSRRTRSSPRTPPPSRSPRSPRRRSAPRGSSGCTS